VSAFQNQISKQFFQSTVDMAEAETKTRIRIKNMGERDLFNK
jgi:hypothetical protein